MSNLLWTHSSNRNDPILRVLPKVTKAYSRRHDIQHNDTQHNDIQHKRLICDTQHKTLFIECHYAECRDLHIVMLSVVMFNVVVP